MKDKLIELLGGYTEDDRQELQRQAYKSGKIHGLAHDFQHGRSKAKAIQKSINEAVDFLKDNKSERGYIVMSLKDEEQLKSDLWDVREKAAHIESHLEDEIKTLEQRQEDAEGLASPEDFQ